MIIGLVPFLTCAYSFVESDDLKRFRVTIPHVSKYLSLEQSTQVDRLTSDGQITYDFKQFAENNTLQRSMSAQFEGKSRTKVHFQAQYLPKRKTFVLDSQLAKATIRAAKLIDLKGHLKFPIIFKSFESGDSWIVAFDPVHGSAHTTIMVKVSRNMHEAEILSY